MGISSSRAFNPERDIPDLTGKVALVTGGNAGIGYATVEHLARKGAKVYMASRTKEKAEAAIAKLKAAGLERVVWLELDLSDPRNAKTAAQEFTNKENRLDILSVLISPFVLTRELLPVLKSTASRPESDIRVVVVSSDGHRLVRGKPRFKTIEDLNDDCSYSWTPSFARYCLSKLTNVLYASELNRRLASSADPAESRIMAISVHPGFVDTFSQKPEVARLHLSLLVGLLVSPFAATPELGAYNTIFAAAAPVVRREREKYGGGYLAPVGKLEEIEEERELDERARELWDTVEKFLKEKEI
ncbi:hypothetical protein EDD17DRAFT_1463378 [Pisolithus thermaeus]|nr:hypothetical protein EDD17DRAFT_1463378 [Pisolithus thermaeus]